MDRLFTRQLANGLSTSIRWLWFALECHRKTKQATGDAWARPRQHEMFHVGNDNCPNRWHNRKLFRCQPSISVSLRHFLVYLNRFSRRRFVSRLFRFDVLITSYVHTLLFVRKNLPISFLLLFSYRLLTSRSFFDLLQRLNTSFSYRLWDLLTVGNGSVIFKIVNCKLWVESFILEIQISKSFLCLRGVKANWYKQN